MYQNFWHDVSQFLFVSKRVFFLLFFFLVFPWSMGYSIPSCQNYMEFCSFQSFSYYRLTVLMHHVGFVFSLLFDVFQRMFYMLLRRISCLQLLSGMLSSYTEYIELLFCLTELTLIVIECCFTAWDLKFILWIFLLYFGLHLYRTSLWQNRPV